MQRRSLQVAGLLALVAGLAAPPAVRAENSHLEEARRAYADLEYDKVTPLLEKALASASGADEEAEIYELLATMHVTYNRDAKAKAAFVELLQRRPDYALPGSSSPKIRQVFEAARAEYQARRPPEPAEPTPPEPSPTAVPAPEPTPAPAPDPAPDPWRTERPRRQPPPVETSAAKDDGPAPFETWWFWTAISTVAAAAIIGGGSYLVWTLTRPQVPATDFGPYQLK